MCAYTSLLLFSFDRQGLQRLVQMSKNTWLVSDKKQNAGPGLALSEPKLSTAMMDCPSNKVIAKKKRSNYNSKYTRFVRAKSFILNHLCCLLCKEGAWGWASASLLLSPACSTTGHISWQIIYALWPLLHSYVKCTWPWESPLTSLGLKNFLKIY